MIRALVVLSCGSSGRNREQKKCLIGNNSRIKESRVYSREETDGRASGREGKIGGRRDEGEKARKV